MKTILPILITLFVLSSCTSEKKSENIITSDIENFWNAYDKIITTEDSIQQYQYLKEDFLDKGTPGLAAIMQVRNYNAESYINAIHNYPKFWTSMRGNMLKASDLGNEMENGVSILKSLYPDLKPAKIYFTVGAFRTNGTTLDSLVLIGSELALADETTPTDEFPEMYSHLRPFFDGKPRENIVFLNVHEFIHTQQISTVGQNLLTRSVEEGIAEFVAELAYGQPSPNACINYGKENNEAVRKAFEKDMFSDFIYDLLMNDFNNEFKQRDLGYYIGYAIAKKNYTESTDKKAAIKYMIELDYTNQLLLEEFVDSTNYFSKPLEELRQAYMKAAPKVVSISPFENGNQEVDASITEITLHFSEPMNKESRGFELGPLGIDNLLRVESVIGYSEDGMSFTFGVKMEPNTHYQLEASSNFFSEKGNRMLPYLIDIKTTNK